MDGGDHLQRDRRNPQKDVYKIAIGEVSARPGQNGVHDGHRGRAGANPDANALPRTGDPEVIAHIHVHEGRDVEGLSTALVNRAALVSQPA